MLMRPGQATSHPQPAADGDSPGSGPQLVASASLIKRLLPEAGKGFNHMASSSDDEGDDSDEAETEGDAAAAAAVVPSQPRIAGPMRLRDRSDFQ